MAPIHSNIEYAHVQQQMAAQVTRYRLITPPHRGMSDELNRERASLLTEIRDYCAELRAYFQIQLYEVQKIEALVFQDPAFDPCFLCGSEVSVTMQSDETWSLACPHPDCGIHLGDFTSRQSLWDAWHRRPKPERELEQF